MFIKIVKFKDGTYSVRKWSFIGNHYQVDVRDDNNEVVVDDATQEPIKMPAFDYFQSIILENKVPLLSLLSIYIINDDAKGAFNF